MIDFESPLFIRLANKRTDVLQRMLVNPSHFRQEAIKLAEYILEKRKESPDYNSFSLSELIDARNHINEENFPVRTSYLDLHISAKKRNDYRSSKEDKKKEQKDAIELNPRLSVSIKKGSNKLDEGIEISVEDFKDFLLDPAYNEYIKIEDSSIELFVMFDPDKNQYGFYFEYFDKYKELEYRSTLHGLSEKYTIEFLKNFLEKGRHQLKTIDWVQIKKKTHLSLILFLIPFVSLVIISICVHFKIYPVYDLYLEYKVIIVKPLLYFFFALSIINIYKDIEQLKNLSKLTAKEKIDTITNLFTPLIFAGVIYFLVF